MLLCSSELSITDPLWAKRCERSNLHLYVITVLLPRFSAGGHHYDKNLVILNTLDPNRQQQMWDVEIL